MDERFAWQREGETILAFAVRWAPFGGGSAEDIWLAFGVTERVYFLRLQHLLHNDDSAGIDDTFRTRLQQVCAQRLAPHSPIDPTDPPERLYAW